MVYVILVPQQEGIQLIYNTIVNSMISNRHSRLFVWFECNLTYAGIYNQTYLKHCDRQSSFFMSIMHLYKNIETVVASSFHLWLSIGMNVDKVLPFQRLLICMKYVWCRIDTYLRISLTISYKTLVSNISVISSQIGRQMWFLCPHYHTCFNENWAKSHIPLLIWTFPSRCHCWEPRSSLSPRYAKPHDYRKWTTDTTSLCV